MEVFLLVVFWSCVATILYAYLGFPFIVALRAALRPAPTPRLEVRPRRVSVIMAAHNEEAVIEAKLDNLSKLNYPCDQLELVVVSDGSDDETAEKVARYPDPRIRLLELPRAGKNAALNEAIAAASGEILVFTDCDTMLDPDALQHLLAPFADPSVGGVGGDYLYGTEAEEGQGERLYWSIDRLWKAMESRGGSMTSATGQIYAIRQTLASCVPDGVTDDFFESTGVIAAGYRLWFARDAIGRGPVAESSEAEFRRKVRVTARGLASVWERRDLLNPRKHGFYAVQLFSHKVLRRLVGIPVIILLPSSLALGFFHPLYAIIFGVQVIFHGAAFAAWLMRTRTSKVGRLLRIPLYFDLVNIAALIALSELLAGKRYKVWVPQRSRTDGAVS